MRFQLPLTLMALLAVFPGTAQACTSGESLPAENEADLCAVYALMGIDRPVKLIVDPEMPRFSARRGPDPKYNPGSHYVLGFAPTQLPGDRWGVTAAFTHELAHLMQFRDLGSPMRVRAYFGTVLALELAADFAMGCVYAELFSHAPISHFQTNVILKSSFSAGHPEFHGRPDQRSSAFDYAIFGHADLCTFDAAMHEGFRDVVLPSLTRNW